MGYWIIFSNCRCLTYGINANVRLFNRTTRSVSLTEAGEQFLKRIVPSMVDLQDAMNELTTAQNRPTGTIRISSAETGAIPLIRDLLYYPANRYPPSAFRLFSQALREWVSHQIISWTHEAINLLIKHIDSLAWFTTLCKFQHLILSDYIGYYFTWHSSYRSMQCKQSH